MPSLIKRMLYRKFQTQVSGHCVCGLNVVYITQNAYELTYMPCTR